MKALTILVIEDDVSMRELIGLHLTNAGYAVRLAEDAIEGGRELLRERADAVICDVQMPYLDGLELLGALKSDAGLRDIPVVLLSASPLSLERPEAVRAAACLLKPIGAAELVSTIAAVLGKASPAA